MHLAEYPDFYAKGEIYNINDDFIKYLFDKRMKL